jgi:hypothetical protein
MRADIAKIHAEGKGFPVNADGHIVSPRYTASETYRAALREWVRANPDKIPDWLKADMQILRGGRAKGR